MSVKKFTASPFTLTGAVGYGNSALAALAHSYLYSHASRKSSSLTRPYAFALVELIHVKSSLMGV